MQILFAATLLTSASLLFLVQPMFAKMVLPLLGGTPSVWNTCMVFYQAVLLAGYVYAHLAIRALGPRRQAILHLLVMGLPWLVLPVAIRESWTPPADSNPTLWLLLLLAAGVGLPFFVVSASAPMLQAWFSRTGHPNARDPYFLYAASNLGSMVALLGYPLVVEPFLTLSNQSRFWAIGYGLLAALTALCAVVLWLSPGRGEESAVSSPTPATDEDLPSSAPTPLQRLRWLALSLVPSALLLAVTTHISTDIASAPLLWIVPLTLYLLSFVFVFARRPWLRHSWMLRVQPFFVLVLGAWFFLASTRINWGILPLHLATFFVMAMVCHGELAARRPPARYLTEFYLWMSLGGVLGGLFSAMLAPVLFAPIVRYPWCTPVLEYPLLIVLGCLLRPTAAGKSTGWQAYASDVLTPVILGGVLWLGVAGLQLHAAKYHQSVTMRDAAILLAVGAMVALAFSPRPLRFALGVVAIMFAGQQLMPEATDLLTGDRGFFGVVRVRQDRDNHRNTLIHGVINHGMQSQLSAQRREPLSYYHRTGPLGQIIQAMNEDGRLKRIGAIGLGTGTIAAYGRPGQEITFYEIDPIVKHLAQDSRYFTYLSDSEAKIRVVLGDAYLTLAQAPPGSYDLLILDAYSSDAIPIHLMTREALARYLEKLAPRGVIAMHISNRYFKLAPIAGRLAADAGLACRVQWDDQVSTEQQNEGKFTSHWVMLARNEADLQPMAGQAEWKAIEVPPGTPLWTNDYSDIARVLLGELSDQFKAWWKSL